MLKHTKNGANFWATLCCNFAIFAAVQWTELPILACSYARAVVMQYDHCAFLKQRRTKAVDIQNYAADWLLTDCCSAGQRTDIRHAASKRVRREGKHRPTTVCYWLSRQIQGTFTYINEPYMSIHYASMYS